jgi:hypothetical protein
MERRESGAGDDGKGHAEAVERNTYTLVKGIAFHTLPDLVLNACNAYSPPAAPGPISPALDYREYTT